MAMTAFKVEKLLDRFLQTAAGKALVAEEQAVTAQDRRRVAARLAQLETEGVASFGKFEASQTKVRTEYEKAKIAIDKASGVLGDIMRARNAECWRIGAERDDLVRMLEETCPAEIGALIEEVRSAIGRVQANGISSAPVGMRSTLTGPPERLYATNARTIGEYLEIAHAVLAEARALRLVPDETEALAKAAELRARLINAYASINIEEVAVSGPVFVKEAK